MLKIDRKDFLSENTDFYLDFPFSIGYNATISAPHMHAYALELLKDHLIKGNKCLDIGSGSGYLTLAFSLMINK